MRFWAWSIKYDIKGMQKKIVYSESKMWSICTEALIESCSDQIHDHLFLRLASHPSRGIVAPAQDLFNE